MSVKIKITIPVDEASPKIAKIREALQNRRPLHAELGQTAVKGLRDHFLSRPANKKGWPRQNFWSERIRNATALTAFDDAGATIVIDDPAMAQKIYGGTIRPGPGKKYLAIPAIAEAYGKSPLQVDGLIPIFGHRGAGTGLLIKKQPGSKIGTAWYFLVKSVTQQADAEALPPEAAYRAALLATVDDYFARL